MTKPKPRKLTAPVLALQEILDMVQHLADCHLRGEFSEQQGKFIHQLQDDLDEIVDILLCDDPLCRPEHHLDDIAEVLGVRRQHRNAVRRRRENDAPTIEAEIIETSRHRKVQ